MTKTLAAKIEAELRWFSLVAAMVGRSDRKEVLLARSAQADARYATVLERHSECMALAGEPGSDVDEAARAAVESSVDQCGEMLSSIVQAALVIEKTRKGEVRVSSTSAGAGIMAPLPPVNVPEFTGDYADWSRFRDIFKSVVHTRTDLSPAYKLAQLLGRLQGEPHDMIAHLEIADSSYETAWGLLVDRYDNRRLIIDGLIEKVFEIPKVISVNDIRSKILNPVTVAVNSLARLNVSLGDNRYIIVNRVLRKLPTEVVARFEPPSLI
jgi:hypothetical protein